MENFDFFCETPLRCFIFIFVGSYMLWWLVLDGPAKWDAYFAGKINAGDEYPIFLQEQDIKNMQNKSIGM